MILPDKDNQSQAPEATEMPAESGTCRTNAQRKRRITSILVSAILVFCVIFCFYIMVQIINQHYVSVAGYSMFRVVTGSMEPEIPVGALLLSKATDIRDIREGDIICFRSRQQGMAGRVITHRVVGILQNEDGVLCLRTKGDANLSEDGYYVTEENFVGKVLWYTGDGSALSSFFSFLTDKIGFLAIVVIPVLLVATLILKDNIKAIGKAMRELEKKEALLQNEEQSEQMSDAAEDTPMNEEEYNEMYQRLREELMEEMRKGENVSSADSKEVGDGSNGSSEQSDHPDARQ